MKTITLTFIAIILNVVGFGQKTLNIGNVKGLPEGNEIGLVRNYSSSEILTFIEASGWQSNYKENKDLVPKYIVRMSAQVLSQFHEEAKNVLFRSIIDKNTDDIRLSIASKYGSITKDEFRRFGLLLITLEKIDITIKYL